MGTKNCLYRVLRKAAGTTAPHLGLGFTIGIGMVTKPGSTGLYRCTGYNSTRIMASANHSLDCSCCSHDSSVPRSVHQTLEEMDFDRGIWSAASNGDFSRVQSFLKKGTDPNSPDLSGYTALHYASRRGDYEICEYLLKNGAHSNAQTKGGATPLHRAAYCGHLPVLKLLLSYGATPAIADDDGATPLHKAAERGHQEVCEALLEQNPALRTTKDRRARAAHDLVTDHPALKQYLQPEMST